MTIKKRQPSRGERNKTAEGLQLVGPTWMAFGDPAPAAFLGAIAPFLPELSVLCLEGTKISKEAKALYLRHASRSTPTRRIAPDTLEPKTVTYHFSATPAALDELSRFIRDNPSAGWGHHIKFYDSEGILVHWHDADTGWFLHLSPRFSNHAVKALGDVLGCKFELVTDGS